MTNRILAIDPGTTQSAFVVLNETSKVESCGTWANEELLEAIKKGEICADRCAIEMVACYGMPVGKEVFETCVWIGRFAERTTLPPRFIYRKDIKIHLCGSMKAKDGNIRQALIDKYGPPGTKKAPGATYGISGHLWSALSVACYALEVPQSPSPASI